MTTEEGYESECGEDDDCNSSSGAEATTGGHYCAGMAGITTALCWEVEVMRWWW